MLTPSLVVAYLIVGDAMSGEIVLERLAKVCGDVVMIIAIGVLASYGPARRARSGNPIEFLRSDQAATWPNDR